MQKNNKEFIEIIEPIINDPEFLKRKDYLHHGKKSVFQHSIEVAYLTYKISKSFGFDYYEATISAILHDFYYKPWQNKEKTTFFRQHGFVHGAEAVCNSNMYFNYLMNKKIENNIKNHMFPLTPVPPKYKEGWILTIADKISSFDVLYKPKILISFFKKKSL